MSWYDLWEPEPCKHPQSAWRIDKDGYRYCTDCGLNETDQFTANVYTSPQVPTLSHTSNAEDEAEHPEDYPKQGRE